MTSHELANNFLLCASALKFSLFKIKLEVHIEGVMRGSELGATIPIQLAILQA